MAVVTGANRGIGTEIARRLREAGYRVVATARDPASARALAAEHDLELHPLDVTDRDSIDALAEAVGPVDALVNNAGVAFDGFDASVVRQTLAVNFYGAMHTTDRFLPRLRAAARVVMVSSGIGALDGMPGPLRRRFEDPALTREELVTLVRSFQMDVESGVHARHGWPTNAYRVSKVALNALTRVLVRELADDARGLRINAVCPGWVATRMGGASAPRTPAKGAETPTWLARLPPDGPTGGFFRDRQLIPW